MKRNAKGAAVADGAYADQSEAPSAEKALTLNEQRVYQELRARGTPMKAYALLAKLQDNGIRAPMTVYRALDTLTRRGLVKKVASLNAFAVVQEGATERIGAFVTCRQCNETREISLSETFIANMLAPAGMAVKDVFIEAYGDCQRDECRRG